jgi:hypothetical protein
MTRFNSPGNRPLTPAQRSYQDGYSDGTLRGERNQYERERIAESNGAASGLAIGVLLAGLIGFGGLGYYLWSQAQTSPRQTPAANPNKIIERTVEKTQVEKPVVVPKPTIVEVPKPVPVPQAAEPVAPNAPQPPSAAGSEAPQPAN